MSGLMMARMSGILERIGEEQLSELAGPIGDETCIA